MEYATMLSTKAGDEFAVEAGGNEKSFTTGVD